jgi:16S rRNA (guanine966-N2)-methyltransferase
MRIIAGHFRGRKLKSPPSPETRPTADRLRETLFNVISSRLAGARFLDLCAGSGAVGIEALSRSAAKVTFVDRSRRMGQLIKSNLDLCRVEANEFELIIMEAADFLRRGPKNKAEPWTVIFFDPPYADNYLPILELLGNERKQILDDKGLLIVEHHHKHELPTVVGMLNRRRILQQGESTLSFYEKVDQEAKAAQAGE